MFACLNRVDQKTSSGEISQVRFGPRIAVRGEEMEMESEKVRGIMDYLAFKSREYQLRH